MACTLRLKRLDPTIVCLAVMGPAAKLGGIRESRTYCESVDPAKLAAIARWRDATVFTELERDVLEYADAVTATQTVVHHELMTRLRERLGVPALGELTALIAVEGLRLRITQSEDRWEASPAQS